MGHKRNPAQVNMDLIARLKAIANDDEWPAPVRETAAEAATQLAAGCVVTVLECDCAGSLYSLES